MFIGSASSRARFLFPKVRPMPIHTAQSASSGVFITFEGGEGAGKSTHIAILAHVLERLGYEVLRLREPGGTSVGEALRAVVLDPDREEMCALSELFVFEASRAQLVSQVIAPALERGAVVLCDRFIDSTTAYQAYGRGIDLDAVRFLNLLACQGTLPARTILMQAADAYAGLARATTLGADRMEQASDRFHARVAQGFDALAACEPERFRAVSSAGSVEDTAVQVVASVSDLFDVDEQALLSMLSEVLAEAAASAPSACPCEASHA